MITDNNPPIIWQTAAGGSVNLAIDIGADQVIDTPYLGYTNAVAAATFELRAAINAHLSNSGSIIKAASAIRAAEAFAPYHAFWTGLGKTCRYLRFYINNPGVVFQAGALCLGQAWWLSWNYEWDSGRGIYDQSIKER